MRMIIVAGLSLGLSFSCAGVPLPREQLTDPGALLFNGYTRGTVDCFHCHNGDAKGARGPSLEHRVPRLGATGITKVIKNGSGFMPKYADMTDDEILQVVGWLKTTFP